MKSPIIAAAVQGLYSFTNEIQAKKFFEQLKNRHIISKSEEKSDSEAMMWVKDYDISEKQAAEGFKGNFGLFKVVKKDRTKFTIIVEKVEIELKKHPVREYPKKEHPNWGHPVLRSIKKKKLYETPLAAQKDLLFLQEEFPMVCIPAPDKLYAMVFEKTENKSGVNKYIFFINHTDEGKFFIDYKQNIPAKKAPVPETKSGKQENQTAIGEFTSKVLIKRAAKRKSPPKGKASIKPVKPKE